MHFCRDNENLAFIKQLWFKGNVREFNYHDNKMTELKENKLVEVCSVCKRACCWYGEFMCDNSENASTELKTVKELRKLKTEESEHYWSDDYMEKVYGEASPFGFRNNGG